MIKGDRHIIRHIVAFVDLICRISLHDVLVTCFGFRTSLEHIDGIGGGFWKRFEDLCEIVEANGELMGDSGNKGVAVATLSLLFLIHKFPLLTKRI